MMNALLGSRSCSPVDNRFRLLQYFVHRDMDDGVKCWSAMLVCGSDDLRIGG